MGFFSQDKDKNKNKKTYMKYEGGKVVTVQVEEKKKSQPINIEPFEEDEKFSYDEYDFPDVEAEEEAQLSQSIEPLPPNEEEKTKNFLQNIKWDTVKKILTSKFLRYLAGTLIIGFFVFSFYDAFETFVAPESGKNQTIDDYDYNNVGNIKDNGTEDTLDSPSNGVYRPEESPLKIALKASNVANNVLVSETNKELGNLKLYLDNKINRFTTLNTLKSHYEEKQKIYIILASSKSIYENEGIMDFYDATETRLLNAMNLTKQIIKIFENNDNRTKILSEVSTFIEREKVLAKNQSDELVKLLKDKEIPYEIHPDSNTIVYKVE